MKLFLDDVRSPPDRSWQVAKDYNEALQILKTGMVKEISFDHDLGDVDTKTGYDVACWIEEQVFLHGFTPPKVMSVHSANPIGSARISQVIQSIEKRRG